MKASPNNRYGGFVIRAYSRYHTHERVWQLKEPTAKSRQRNLLMNDKIRRRSDFETFVAKVQVQRAFKTCPNKWKLVRARKSSLQQIHGDEER